MCHYVVSVRFIQSFNRFRLKLGWSDLSENALISIGSLLRNIPRNIGIMKIGIMNCFVPGTATPKSYDTTE